MGRFLLKLSSYLLIFSLIIGAINQLTHQSTYPFWGESQDYENKFRYLLGGKNDVDVIAIGSSYIKDNMNPHRVMDVCDSLGAHIKILNLGDDGQLPPKTHFLLKKVLEQIDKTKVKKILLEARPLAYEHHKGVRRFNYWVDFNQLWNYCSLTLSLNTSISQKYEFVRSYLRLYFEQLRDWEKYKSAIKGQRGSFPNKDYFHFSPLDSLLDLEISRGTWSPDSNPHSAYLKRVKSKTTLPQEAPEMDLDGNVKVLLDLISLAESKGIHLLFLSTGDENSETLLKSLPKANTMNLNLDEYYYQVKYHFDEGHLNAKGAQLFSQYLGLGLCNGMCQGK